MLGNLINNNHFYYYRSENKMHTKFTLLPLAVCINMLFVQPIFAETTDTETPETKPAKTLQNVRVKSKRFHTPNVDRKSQITIQNELIRDTRDLVRYSTDVGIADNGRHLKGFALRGVEGNRVGISIDGVSLPDSEENSLYARYGNFNPSRLSIDPELVQHIDITKGSSSFESGSGALGGNINYRTLDAKDIVSGEQKFGALLRSGYGSKNREWANTIGVGYMGEALDAVLLYSQRYGHEMKSNGSGPFTSQSQSQHPDPATHRYHSYLGKVNYRITDDHRVGLSLNGQQGKNDTDERSYTSFGSAWREAIDKHKRFNGNMFYEYTPDSPWLARLRTDIDYQRTNLSAYNLAGVRDYKSNEKDLDETKDRRMLTRYRRISLLADFQPFQAWGEHSTSLKIFAAQRNFSNINYDTIGIGSSYQAFEKYTIQYPTRTKQFGLSLKDSIKWNDQWSGQLGIRYDHESIKPQALNAQCSKACLAEGKPRSVTFNNWNGFANVQWQFMPEWRLGYGIQTGYRVPTASELFFTYQNPYGTWKSNPNLKAERSLNQTLSLQGRGSKGSLDLSVYHNKYSHFLFEQENLIETSSYGRVFQTPMMQMINLDKARISGLEFSGNLNIHNNWKLFGALGYSHGKLSSESSLLSIQPLKVVLGLDYEAPSERWGVFSRLSYYGAKKARDAKTTEIKDRCTRYEFDYWFGEQICTNIEKYQETVTYKYLNKPAVVLDVFGFYKPINKLTLRAGVYNVFNRRYHTWDALRGINANNTTNGVDRNGYGLQRFYAPSRHFAVSAEYRF